MSALDLRCDNPARQQALRDAIRKGAAINGIEYVVAQQKHAGFETKLYLFADLKSPRDPFPDAKDAASRVKLRNSLRVVSSQGNELHISAVTKPHDQRYLQFTIDDPRARTGVNYRVQVVDPDDRNKLLAGMDPRHSQIDLRLSASNPLTGSDPAPAARPPQSIGSEPELSYLAKDFASFKQLILDRLALTMPNWTERHTADLGMTIVELLAYMGDRLSYYQDAVATEAYLRMARQRVSVRRHARLVDYRVHEGCNARALMDVRVTNDVGLESDQVYFITAPPDRYQLDAIVLTESDLPPEIYNEIVIYEPVLLPRSEMLHPCDVRDESMLRSRVSENSELNRLAHLGFEPLENGDDIPLQKLVANLNQALSEADLLTLYRSIIGTDSCRSAVLRSVTGDRASSNRVVLDQLLGDAISPANLDGRLHLYLHHNCIRIYSWGDEECWLPLGTTSATLIDEVDQDEPCSPSDVDAGQRILKLGVGDALILEEVLGPKTGQDSDADSTHRQAVRLTHVCRSVDPVTGTLLLEVEWSYEDALRFPLCVSSRQSAPNCQRVEDVSVARGNVVLVDHGRTIPYEQLGRVDGQWRQVDCGTQCIPPRHVQDGDPFRPLLREILLTFSESIDEGASVQRLFERDPRSTQPSISLVGTPSTSTAGGVLQPDDLHRPGMLLQLYTRLKDDPVQHQIRFQWEQLLDAETVYKLSERLPLLNAQERQELGERLAYELRRAGRWQPRYDLINSGPSDQHFVVEMANERRAQLRMGDGSHGKQPFTGTQFFATYRIGQPVMGNVGAERISRMVSRNGTGGAVSQVRNPFPAVGGKAPETIQEVKLLAPHDARQNQQRAVIDRDYAELVMRRFGDRIQNARASIVWSGSYWCARVVVDPLAAVRNTEALIAEIQAWLQRVRRLWHRVHVTAGQQVPIDLGMTVCVRDGHLQSEVRRELADVLSNRDLGDGRRGFFHPDNLSFGQSIFVSEIIAEAKRVAGVENVDVTHLCRLGTSGNVAGGTKSATNVLPIGPLEIAQLDSEGGDENGRLCLLLEGGR